jgi:hypothetical protein
MSVVQRVTADQLLGEFVSNSLDKSLANCISFNFQTFYVKYHNAPSILQDGFFYKPNAYESHGQQSRILLLPR